ncbi:MAG: hypothetical protein ACLFRT_14330 [Actinomycetota bacterium]
MTSPESRRHDLYNGLTEVLGVERADVLMTYLPSTESTELATKADIRAVETRIDSVESSLATRIDRLEANLTTRFDALDTRIDTLGTRIDRIVLAVVAALVVIIARTFF